MTPEETLDWLAQQHFDQCREERPIQDWIRKMKSQLPEQPEQEPRTAEEKLVRMKSELAYMRKSQPAVAEQHKQEPVALSQVYRCQIKSRKQIDKEIPREKQGWWADISAGQKLLLRQAVQADIDRCTLNNAHSKDPADYMCETFTNGSLVSKAALEYMNPEQNVFASTTPPQPQNEVRGNLSRKPLDMTEIVRLTYDIDEDKPATMAELFRFARAIEAAHGIHPTGFKE